MIAAEFAPLSGDHQPDWRSAVGGAQENGKQEPLERGADGRGWGAGADLLTEKNFRKLLGHRDLWTLAAALGREKTSVTPKEHFA